jgi:hypothetical protein
MDPQRQGEATRPACRVGLPHEEVIVVVSGLPRSGTSMMMQMLEAGGAEILTDQVKAADEDNLKGYYEFEKVKALPQETSWLEEAGGKVVKIISELLRHLPEKHTYKIIFMRRDVGEILASQGQMLIRRGVASPGGVGDGRMAEVFRKHLREVEAWLAGQPNVAVFYADYNEMLKAPARWAEEVDRFLGGRLDVKRMAGVVDGVLYRQRRQESRQP